MRKECGRCIYGKTLRDCDRENPKFNLHNFGVGKVYCDLRCDIHKAKTEQRNCKDFEEK